MTRPGVVDLQRLVEAAAFARWASRKRAGMSAFVARPSPGAGAGRSVVLIGDRGGPWSQAIKCWNGDHMARAVALARDYNAVAVVADCSAVAVVS